MVMYTVYKVISYTCLPLSLCEVWLVVEVTRLLRRALARPRGSAGDETADGAVGGDARGVFSFSRADHARSRFFFREKTAQRRRAPLAYCTVTSLGVSHLQSVPLT